MLRQRKLLIKGVKAMPKNNWEELNTRLEEIISLLQSQSVDIDKASELYEEALKIIKELESYIQNAKNKIKKVG